MNKLTWSQQYHLDKLQEETGVAWIRLKPVDSLNERQLLHALEETRIEAKFRAKISATLLVLTLGLAATLTLGIVFGSVAAILVGAIVTPPMAVLLYVQAAHSLRPTQRQVRRISAVYQDRILDGAS